MMGLLFPPCQTARIPRGVEVVEGFGRRMHRRRRRAPRRCQGRREGNRRRLRRLPKPKVKTPPHSHRPYLSLSRFAAPLPRPNAADHFPRRCVRPTLRPHAVGYRLSSPQDVSRACQGHIVLACKPTDWSSTHRVPEPAPIQTRRVCVRVSAMAPPRRHHGQVQGLLAGIDSEELTAPAPPATGVTRCCVPNGECLRVQQQQISPNNNDPMLISLDDLRDTVRVTCNNDSCTVGRYMHRECFDVWEQTVLAYLKTCGRARSWSERQRHQNLWTKKGYDLAYKACGCKCGRGHLKKDLDYTPPPPTLNICGRVEEVDLGKKKKRRNRTNSRPSLAINTYHPSNPGEGRGRAGSLSSSTGSSSPPATVSEPSISPVHAGSKKKPKFEFADRSR